MMIYNENPPVNLKDKKYIDGLVCDLIDCIVSNSIIMENIETCEKHDFSNNRFEKMKVLYTELENNLIDHEQINLLFKNAKAFK